MLMYLNLQNSLTMTTATEVIKSIIDQLINQSAPTDLTGYVNLFLNRTGIRTPVRLELYRHTYLCATQVRQEYILQPMSIQQIVLATDWLKYVCLYNPSRTGIRMPV